MSIRVQNPWFFFPVKVEDSNFSKIRIFWWEISTAYRNFRLSEKISFKNFKFDVNHCAVQKASNSVGWSYKTRFLLLDVQTFVEKRIMEIAFELVIFNKKLLNSKNSVFFTSEKSGSTSKVWESWYLSCGFGCQELLVDECYQLLPWKNVLS